MDETISNINKIRMNDYIPVYVLCILVLLVPFDRGRTIVGQVSIVDVWLFFVFICCCLFLFFPREKLLLPPPLLLISSGIFCVVISASLIQSKDKLLSLRYLLRWGEVFFIYIFAFNFLNTFRKRVLVIQSFLVMTTFISTLGIFQFFRSNYDYFSVVGTFKPGEHCLFSLLLALSFPVVLSFFISSTELNKKLLWGSACIVQLLGLIFSFSRTILISVICCTVLFILLSKSRKKVFAFLCFGFLFLIFIILSQHICGGQLLPRIKASFSGDFGGRLPNFSAAIKMIKNNPLLGVGIGNFQVRWEDYCQPQDKWLKAENAHSFYLNMAAETGLLGLISLLFVLGIHLTFVLTKIGEIENPNSYNFVLGCLCGTVSFWFSGVTEMLNAYSMDLISVVLLVTAMLEVRDRGR